MKRALLALIGVLAVLATGLLPAQPALANTETLTIVQNTNGVHQATIGGAVTVNDTVTLTINDVDLPGGQKSISTTVNSGDTLRRIARRLANRINANADLELIGVVAENNENVVTITSASINTTSFTASTSAGATLTVALSVNTNPVVNAIIAGTLTTGDELRIIVHDVGIPNNGQRRTSHIVQPGDTLQSIAQTMAADLTSRNALDNLGIAATAAGNVVTIRSYSPNATTYTSRVIGTQPTETITLSPNQNTRHNIIVGGTVTAGDVVAFVVADAGLPGGQKAVSYSVQSGDDLAAIAAGLSGAVNGDLELSALGITADSTGGPVLTIASNSANATTYQIAQGVTVTCTPIPSSTGAWPSPAQALQCTGVFPPQMPGLMRSTLEEIGLLPYDAAFRLKEQIPAGQQVGIQITDPSVNNGQPVSKTLTTTGTSSAVTVARELAEAINSDPTLQPVVSATASASDVFLASSSGNTSYVDVDGNGVTISISNLGGGVHLATVAGTPVADITWRIFESRGDYDLSNEPNNRIPPGDDPQAAGVTYTNEGDPNPILNEKASSIFESFGPAGGQHNNIIKNVTAHETGHQLDFIYGKLFNNGAEFSKSTQFQAALRFDLEAMRRIPPCRFEAIDPDGNYASSGTSDPDPNHNGGVPGLFTGEKDSDGDYICAGNNGEGRLLSGKYSTANDALDVIFGPLVTAGSDPYTAPRDTSQAAYPNVENLDEEIFTETAAVVLGFLDFVHNDGSVNNPGSDTVLLNTSAFVCSKLYAETLVQHGRLPNSTELSTSIYVVPLPEEFGEPGVASKGPQFRIYRCDFSAPTDHDYGPFGG